MKAVHSIAGVLAATVAGLLARDGEAEPAADAHSSSAVYALSAAFGFGHARADSRYDLYFLEDPGAAEGSRRDPHEEWTPGGGLTLFAGWSLALPLVLGGALTVGGVAEPHPFIDSVELTPYVQIGPELLWQERGSSPYLLLRGGVGTSTRRTLSWGGVLGGGYAVGTSGSKYVALGIEATAFFDHWTSEGDFGMYTYDQRWLGLALAVRLGAF